jgi:hypothetical protein
VRLRAHCRRNDDELTVAGRVKYSAYDLRLGRDTSSLSRAEKRNQVHDMDFLGIDSTIASLVDGGGSGATTAASNAGFGKKNGPKTAPAPREATLSRRGYKSLTLPTKPLPHPSWLSSHVSIANPASYGTASA